MKKVCPIMSTSVYDPLRKTIIDKEIICKRNNCQLWTHVYTTEENGIEGCAYELTPNMHNGQFRV